MLNKYIEIKAEYIIYTQSVGHLKHMWFSEKRQRLGLKIRCTNSKYVSLC